MKAIVELPILAKSSAGGRQITLARHIEEVLGATEAMFGGVGRPTRLALNWLHFFGLDPSHFDRFFINLWLAAAYHDLGKANSGFQAMIRHQGMQDFRHEHLSALLVGDGPLAAWLLQHRNLGVDQEIVTASVASHHLKVNDETLAMPILPRDAPTIQVYAESQDICRVLELATSVIGTPAPDLAPDSGQWAFHTATYRRREAVTRLLARFNREIRRDEARQRLLVAVKTAVIAVGSAGSVALREGLEVREWLAAAFDVPPLTRRDIERGVVEPRIAELAQLGRWQGFHDFQLAADSWGNRTLLLSGCGTGKTLAAWRWAAARLEEGVYTRVLFLYPTRATATEGFRDHVSWAGPEVAALAHGTSGYDLPGMFANPSDARHGADYTTEERLFALGYWHRRVFSATVDTFLAAMSHRYAALCLLPILAESVVIIDEVHSFDKAMFRALERFLKFFQLPVLCMTASLPEDRRRTFVEGCGMEVFPSDPVAFADLQRQVEAPRYRVARLDGATCESRTLEALAEGKKVLWVANTVARCQEAARSLANNVQMEGRTLCYHSRFRLADRKRRHEEVISLFKRSPGPLLLVSTQVCEMSLDLDADVLTTEAAPVPALIQRMGRCCRQPTPSPGRLGRVYVSSPPSPLPYVIQEVQQGEAFADRLASQPTVSQQDLAGYLAGLEMTSPFMEGGFSSLLDCGAYAMARDDAFRENHDWLVEAILDIDLDAYLAAVRRRDPEAQGYILPVPRRLAAPHPALGPYLFVAPAAHYHPDYGFVDTPVEVP